MWSPGLSDGAGRETLEPIGVFGLWTAECDCSVTDCCGSMHHTTRLHIQYLLIVSYQQPESVEMQENIICRLPVFFSSTSFAMCLGELFWQSFAFAGRGSSPCFCNMWGAPEWQIKSVTLKPFFAETICAASIADTASAVAASTMPIMSCTYCQHSEKGPCSNSSPGDTGKEHTPVCSCAWFFPHL